MQEEGNRDKNLNRYPKIHTSASMNSISFPLASADMSFVFILCSYKGQALVFSDKVEIGELGLQKCTQMLNWLGLIIHGVHTNKWNWVFVVVVVLVLLNFLTYQ